MNVSQSIEWKQARVEELHGHRFLARTWNGNTLDSHLAVHGVGPMTYLTDQDFNIPIIIIGRGPQPNTLAPAIRSINVLEERS